MSKTFFLHFIRPFLTFPLAPSIRDVVKEPFRENLLLFLVSWSVAVFSGCDQGLAPEPPPAYGIAGTIYFTNWPPPDSVRNLALVAFKNYPQGNLINIVGDPNKAKFKLGIAPYGVDSVIYELLLSPTPFGIYEYIAVGQQYGPIITRDWRVAGLFTAPGDTSRNPALVFVPANDVLRGIDIHVDFRNPPPQP